MTDDAKKLDEWRWAETLRLTAPYYANNEMIATYRRLVVEDARPPEISEATQRMAKILGAEFVPNRQPEPVAMTKEWCIKMAELEGDAEIGAGAPDHPLRCPPEPVDDGLDFRGIAKAAIVRMRAAGESHEMLARWISEDIHAELASRGLAVRPVVAMTRTDLARAFHEAMADDDSDTALFMAAFLLGADKLAEAVERAAITWCGQKKRETFMKDIIYFRHNWRSFPGMRAYVVAKLREADHS